MPAVETAVLGAVSFPVAGAWEFVDLTPLMQEADGRGDDLTIPGAAGVTFKPRVRDELTVSLPILVYGDNDESLVAHADVRSGLKANVGYLNTNLLAQNVGSITATVTYPDATTLAGPVAVERVRVENLSMRATVLRGVLRVRLLNGRLT